MTVKFDYLTKNNEGWTNNISFIPKIATVCQKALSCIHDVNMNKPYVLSYSLSGSELRELE